MIYAAFIDIDTIQLSICEDESTEMHFFLAFSLVCVLTALNRLLTLPN
jgi:hypothetical protein